MTPQEIDHIADSVKKVSISCGQENDLISKQATIDLVGDWIYNPEDLRYHKDVINSIPAVQPDHNADVSKKAEGDCISRQAAIDTIMGQPPEPHYPSWYAAQIEKIPAVQSEIIRCKDCKFSHMTNDGRYCKYCDQFTDDYGELVEMYFDSDFYCGYAERRTECR